MNAEVNPTIEMDKMQAIEIAANEMSLSNGDPIFLIGFSLFDIRRFHFTKIFRPMVIMPNDPPMTNAA